MTLSIHRTTLARPQSLRPCGAPAYASGPSVAARHLPTLWGVTLYTREALRWAVGGGVLDAPGGFAQPQTPPHHAFKSGAFGIFFTTGGSSSFKNISSAPQVLYTNRAIGARISFVPFVTGIPKRDLYGFIAGKPYAFAQRVGLVEIVHIAHHIVVDVVVPRVISRMLAYFLR